MFKTTYLYSKKVRETCFVITQDLACAGLNLNLISLKFMILEKNNQ